MGRCACVCVCACAYVCVCVCVCVCACMCVSTPTGYPNKVDLAGSESLARTGNPSNCTHHPPTPDTRAALISIKSSDPRQV